MTHLPRNSVEERDVEQAITVLKKGSHLLKYGRRGKPKFCPFRLSNDETTIIWYVGKEERQLELRHVSRIIPGQRTPLFQRYPQPEKEYQSFSLIYGNRSLDLICKHKDEAEIWFVALRAIISRSNCQNWRNDMKRDSVSSENSSCPTHRTSHSFLSSSSSDIAYEDPKSLQKNLVSLQSLPQKRLGRAVSDYIVYSEPSEPSPFDDFIVKPVSCLPFGGYYDLNDQTHADSSRLSVSSAISSSSQGSPLHDFNSLSDTYIWGQEIGDGLLGGASLYRTGKSSTDSHIPKPLESTSFGDPKTIACGSKHAALITKNGDIFTWGEGSGGKLGHGIESDFSNPMHVNALSGMHVETVACGENHTLAVTLSGDLYSWGDGIHNYGILGHGNELSQWTPKKISGSLEGINVISISCGPWHSAAVTSKGILFTFGEGIFGALGHGDRNSTSIPMEIETLKGQRVVSVSCGAWHTAAIVGTTSEPPSGKIFTWGDGDKGQLGHGDKDSRLVPSCVSALNDTNFIQVACGNSMTVALTTSGQVYTMGSTSPGCSCKLPVCVEGLLKNNFVEEIACGSHHVAALSSKSWVYTWGKGANGQLGHGDNCDRDMPALVEALKDKQARSVVCGSNFTAIICAHKRASADDHSVCSGCQTPFSFMRKQHNCYNCGIFFCNNCTLRKSLKAALAPDIHKPYRVCEDCFNRLNKKIERRFSYRPPAVTNVNVPHSSGEYKETMDSKARRLLSRLSSFNSFKIRNTKKNAQMISYNGHASPGTSQRDSVSSPNSSAPSIYDCSEKISASPPVSTMNSRGASPVSIRSSPSHSVSLSWDSVVTLDMKRTNENLTKEIYLLKEQVDLLAQRSQLLEAEQKRMAAELTEATEVARAERDKKLAAMELIESLSIQVKNLGGEVPQEYSSGRISDTPPQQLSDPSKVLQ